MSSNRLNQPGAIIIGLGLMFVGVWTAVRGFGVPLIALTDLWPIFVSLIGAALFVQYAAGQSGLVGLVFFGVVAVLSGLFLLVFTLEVGRLTWFDMIRYWPIFPAIIGVGFLAMFVADGMRNEAILKPAYLIGGVGIFALPLTTGVLGGGIMDQVARFWPLLFIPLVILVVLQIRARRSQPPS